MSEYIGAISPSERRFVRRVREALERSFSASLTRDGELLSQVEIDTILGWPTDAVRVSDSCRQLFESGGVFSSMALSQTEVNRIVDLAVYGSHPPDENRSMEYRSEVGFGYPPASTIDETLSWFLQYIDPKHEQIFIDTLDEVSSGLGLRVANLQSRPTFVAIESLSDRDIQRLLRELDSRLLATSLKGASDKIKARIIANMSKRAAAMLLDDMDCMGSVDATTVQGARIDIARRFALLVRSGDIVYRGDSFPDDPTSECNP